MTAWGFRVLVRLLWLVAPLSMNGADLECFPLAGGNEWLLSNGSTGAKARISVLSNTLFATKRMVRLHLETPAGNFTLLVSPESGVLALEGIDYGAQRSYFDASGTLFSDLATEGQSWSNALGTVTLISADTAVATPLGIFPGCRRFQMALTWGVVLDWYLAPGVGVVRLDDDANPYLLTATNAQPYLPPATTEPAERACPRIGIAPNPPVGSAFSVQDEEATLKRALASGLQFMNLEVTWSEVEPTRGSYNFDKIVRWTNWSQAYGFDVVLTIRAVDSTRLSTPADLRGKSLDSMEVTGRFYNLVSAIAARLPDTVKWVNLGNEVDTYLTSHPEDLRRFMTFYLTGVEALKRLRKAVSVGTVFTFADFRRNDFIFRVISPYCEHISFTYYPLKWDWSVRDPGIAGWDVAEMAAASEGKPVILTEVGYPSAEQLGASLDAQRAFYSNVFDALESIPGVSAASFFLMNEIPDWAISDLSVYYEVSDVTRFSAFLSSLGLNDRYGTPKPAWFTFADRAVNLKSAGSCVSRPF